jgi:hypothetical protein
MAKRNARSITQENLQAVAEKRALIARLEAELKAVEATVLESLKAGASIAPGLLTARVKTYERRNVAWKEIVIREKGEDYADRVLNATRPDKYESLVVEIAGR